MISSILFMSTPILLAALGGLFTELSGVLNIALEGLMLIGAFSAVIATGITGSVFIGTLAAAIAGTGLAYIFGFITLRFRANIFITGLAVNLFALGFINYLSEIIFNTKGVIRFPDFPNLPVIAGNNVYIYIGILSTAFVFLIIYKTVFGLRVRASGYNSEVLKIKGVAPYPVQMKSILLSGAFSGLGGAVLSLNIGAYVPNMTAGRGWIALVAIYLGRKHPIGIFITCLIFAGAEYFSNAAQGALHIPSDLLLGFPYLITLIGMIIFSVLSNRLK
ncbi:MAG: ABC transporter permease [Spirochaetaceae bacterium]|nr:ABC transporter permease [Spirochaetaceae bacterium]